MSDAIYTAPRPARRVTLRFFTDTQESEIQEVVDALNAVLPSWVDEIELRRTADVDYSARINMMPRNRCVRVELPVHFWNFPAKERRSLIIHEYSHAATAMLNEAFHIAVESMLPDEKDPSRAVIESNWEVRLEETTTDLAAIFERLLLNA